MSATANPRTAVPDTFSAPGAAGALRQGQIASAQHHPDEIPFYFPESLREGQRAIRRNGRLLGIMGYNMKGASIAAPGTDLAILLFDANGALLNLYGEAPMLESLRADGIALYTTWQLDKVGVNAVTVGLQEKMQLYTVGVQNQCAELQKYGIYFSPVHFEPPANGRVKVILEHGFFGGVALIARECAYQPIHATLLATIKHDLLMSLQYKQSSFNHYEKIGTGVVSINFTSNGGETGRLSYVNSTFLQIMGLPKNDELEINGEIDPQRDLIFHRTEELFEPLPKNREFWNALKERKTLNGSVMTLSMHGHDRKCIVFSEPSYQPDLDISSMVFYISAFQQKEGADAAGKTKDTAFDNVIGQSRRLTEVIERSRRIARTESNVMIFGESGTGKEVFARAIHSASRRSGKPFIAVNCGAIPRDLVASELFGYVGGAFTGANRQGSPGKFELANGGTLFLDEIGECPLDVQAALLRVVEQKQFMRVGGGKMITADVRIISATNAPLLEMILQKKFREDLFYRLGTMQIVLPPLRERREDIVPLASYFIQRYSHKMEKEFIPVLSPAAEQALKDYDWPGNVRELRNSMECIVSLYEDAVIEPWQVLENIGLYTPEPRAASPKAAAKPASPTGLLTKEDILDALRHCGGNRSEAARYLGIARKTLYRNMERLGISKEE